MNAGVNLPSTFRYSYLKISLNVRKSEIANTFDETRAVFTPYGFTCEVWKPNVMVRADRHNEIEVNYSPSGTFTYLVQGKKIRVEPGQLTTFWGLIPHRIIDYDVASPYYVCTIPFALFLEWQLPTPFTDRLLKGEVLSERAEKGSDYDDHLFRQWIDDASREDLLPVVLLELRARMHRMALNIPLEAPGQVASIPTGESSLVERMALYIAQNYRQPIGAVDVGGAVGLHADYANSLFKKAFGSTLSESIAKERIAYAQRRLVATDDKITEIAYASGYRTISSFNAAFRRLNNCTPREFRRNCLA